MSPRAESDRFADMLVKRPPRESWAAAISLLDGGMSARRLYLDVLGPALREVGTCWQRGLVSVAQEHLATAVVTSMMATLAPRLAEPPPVHRRAVLACTEGELHDVGLRMVGDFLESDGWDVYFLGALTPPEELTRLVDEVKPDVVGLSTSLTTHLGSAERVIGTLRDRPDAPLVLVGGGAYGGHADVALALGADAFFSDAGEVSSFLRGRFGPEPARPGA